MTALAIAGTTLSEETARRLARPETWYGPSGTKVTGEAVAAHLQAAAALMARENWDPQPHTSSSRRNLYYALLHTGDDGLGDDDTRHVAERLLGAVLAEATGAPFVDYEAWNHHATRTLEDVLRACRATAAVAREYGPGPITGHPQIEPGQTR
ncbi:hypothetical protein SAMN04490357_7665 [Streptomyces misionensis]|uniref:Uncharacterized protein n=1 Tax=Streptomyces misionensis TaxID=67331 RepID=A0A1H5K2G1_9ACTN|nr:hypothetical protein [Streptomyces misionensis]SEE58784.1 hypothetical protein SAMN04490357_7665 [Streptomyces misionensis]